MISSGNGVESTRAPGEAREVEWYGEALVYRRPNCLTSSFFQEVTDDLGHAYPVATSPTTVNTRFVNHPCALHGSPCSIPCSRCPQLVWCSQCNDTVGTLLYLILTFASLSHALSQDRRIHSLISIAPRVWPAQGGVVQRGGGTAAVTRVWPPSLSNRNFDTACEVVHAKL